MAAEKTARAQETWDKTKLCKRMGIWNRAADLIAGKYRFKIIAATMIGQGKTVRQAELDVADLVDFMRINPIFLRDLANYEPLNDQPEVCRNQMRLRGLTGFVAAISPFNYTSLAANLAFTPALMGNTVLWKPSDSSILSNWFVYQAMQEAGLPSGVVNFVPAAATDFATVITQHSKLAGINFTGTASVLKVLWQQVAQNINVFHNYPRLVGDCGGKNFHFVHASADPAAVVACTIRGAFEYAGQKCTSCSMLYVPESLWKTQIKESLLKITKTLFVSDATFCDCFYSAVIDKNAFKRIQMYLKYINDNPTCEVLIGGTCCKKQGYYVDPTIVQITDLNDRICKDELLAPILCVHVYPDAEVMQTMEKVARVNHGLIGSIFANDTEFIKEASDTFKLNVGNLNINDKCTGCTVGKQPLGGGHITGTNDKIGSPHTLAELDTQSAIK
ncbi:delta-1-pyrroline-5-carboxylate dehydrogenase, mitochondrial isoform X2 [Drosophila tropicalis]